MQSCYAFIIRLGWYRKKLEWRLSVTGDGIQAHTDTSARLANHCHQCVKRSSGLTHNSFVRSILLSFLFSSPMPLSTLPGGYGPFINHHYYYQWDYYDQTAVHVSDARCMFSSRMKRPTILSSITHNVNKLLISDTHPSLRLWFESLDDSTPLLISLDVLLLFCFQNSPPIV